MCMPVSEYIIHFCCICTSLDPCFCLSFSLIVYICVQLYCHWLYVYRYVSYSAFWSVSLLLCLSQCPGYIIGNLRSTRSVCNRALKNWCIIIIILNSAYIPTSLYSYFCLSLFGSECPLQCPDMLWLIVCAYASLDHVCFSLSLWTSVVVFGYIVFDCRFIFPSLDPCFSLSFFLNTSISVRLYCHWLYVNRFFLSVSVSGMLSVILRLYVRLLICISFSFFDSKCV